MNSVVLFFIMPREPPNLEFALPGRTLFFMLTRGIIAFDSGGERKREAANQHTRTEKENIYILQKNCTVYFICLFGLIFLVSVIIVLNEARYGKEARGIRSKSSRTIFFQRAEPLLTLL